MIDLNTSEIHTYYILVDDQVRYYKADGKSFVFVDDRKQATEIEGLREAVIQMQEAHKKAYYTARVVEVKRSVSQHMVTDPFIEQTKRELALEKLSEEDKELLRNSNEQI